MSSTTAVVTGASSGIGALYAEGLARRGHDLILIARRKDRLDAVAARIEAASGVRVEVLAADLADASDLSRIAARIGGDPNISILVNNAGAASFSPLETIRPEALDEMIAVNVTALTRLTRAVLPGLVRRGAGALSLIHI